MQVRVERGMRVLDTRTPATVEIAAVKIKTSSGM